MSNTDFVLHAVTREDKGKGASRRLRHQGNIKTWLIINKLKLNDDKI